MDFEKRKSIFGLVLGVPLISLDVARAQNVDWGEVLKSIAKTPNNNPTETQPNNTAGILGNLSNLDANNGLKEALTNGAIAAVLRLGKLDGYWADGKVRIPLPKPLNNIQRNLQPLGLSYGLDDLQLKINRAAETAAPKAKQIFLNAISNITFDDVMGIINGGNTAGTDFLKAKTKTALLNEFAPPMLGAVQSTGAGKAFDKASKKYGSQLALLGGLGNIRRNNGVESTNTNTDLNSQLVDFAASRALDGLFYYIGQEESAIRKDPVKRTSDLLKKVFGKN